MAVLGLRFCAKAFSSCGKQGPLFIVMRGPLFIAVRGPLTIVAPPVAGHRLQTRRLSSCGSWAQLLRGMWDLPRPGLEPVSPALAGRLSTTALPGKPLLQYFKHFHYCYICYVDLWLVIFDVTVTIVLGHHEPCPYKTANLIDKCCVCSDYSTAFPHLSPSLQASLFPEIQQYWS